MAKVTDPINQFLVSKRLGKNTVLRKRKEGLTVSFFQPQKAPVFFDPNPDTLIKTDLEERWQALTEGEKQTWEEQGAEIGLTGETFYKMQEKKTMSTGFYGLATYGASKRQGVLLTIYSTVYNVAIYGVSRYRKL